MEPPPSPYTLENVRPLRFYEKRHLKGGIVRTTVILDKSKVPLSVGENVAIIHGYIRLRNPWSDDPEPPEVFALASILKSQVKNQCVFIVKTWDPVEYPLHSIHWVDSIDIAKNENIDWDEWSCPDDSWDQKLKEFRAQENKDRAARRRKRKRDEND